MARIELASTTPTTKASTKCSLRFIISSVSDPVDRVLTDQSMNLSERLINVHLSGNHYLVNPPNFRGPKPDRQTSVS